MKSVIIIMSLMLSACSDYIQEITYDHLPFELQDCKVYETRVNYSTSIVFKCPKETITATPKYH